MSKTMMATTTSPMTKMRSQEDDKKYKKALRFIYKYGQESNKLTEEAIEACKRQNINAEDLIVKTVDDFAVHPKSNQSPSASPKNRHQQELLESEKNLAIVRVRHHENRRKSKQHNTLHRVELTSFPRNNRSCHSAV